MKNYLYLAIANVRARGQQEPTLNDPYVVDAVNAFTGAGNNRNQIVESKTRIDWSVSSAMEREYKFTRESKSVLALFHKPTQYYFGKIGDQTQYLNMGNVDKNDVVYIVGHATFMNDMLMRKDFQTKTEFDVYRLSPAALAKSLALSGLPKSHKYLKVNSCYGGGSDLVIPFSDLSISGSAPLAYSLAKELGKLGYNNILVGGYNFMTLHDGNDLYLCGILKTSSEGADIRQIDSSKLKNAYAPRPVDSMQYSEDPYRCWYNATGEMVRWNEPDLGDLISPEMLNSDDSKYRQLHEYREKVKNWEDTLRTKGLI